MFVSVRNKEYHRRNLKLSREPEENHHIASRNTEASTEHNKSHLKYVKFLGTGETNLSYFYLKKKKLTVSPSTWESKYVYIKRNMFYCYYYYFNFLIAHLENEKDVT